MIAAAATMDGVSYNEHVAILSRAHSKGSLKTFEGAFPDFNAVRYTKKACWEKYPPRVDLR